MFYKDTIKMLPKLTMLWQGNVYLTPYRHMYLVTHPPIHPPLIYQSTYLLIHLPASNHFIQLLFICRCHASLGDFRQSAFHCEQSTESVRRRFGSESVECAHELHKFAQLLFNGRETNKALTVIELGIRLLTIHYGPQYSDVEELQKMKKALKNFAKGKT